jgi:protein translocase SecG subunit
MVSLYFTLVTVHIVICFLLGIFVIFQKTSGEGLLASTNKNPFMSGNEVASLLTKITSIFVIAFFVNAIFLASIGSRVSKNLSLSSQQVQGEESSQSSTK